MELKYLLRRIGYAVKKLFLAKKCGPVLIYGTKFNKSTFKESQI